MVKIWIEEMTYRTAIVTDGVTVIRSYKHRKDRNVLFCLPDDVMPSCNCFAEIGQDTKNRLEDGNRNHGGAYGNRTRDLLRLQKRLKIGVFEEMNLSLFLKNLLNSSRNLLTDTFLG